MRDGRGDEHRLEHDSAGRIRREVTFDGRELTYRHDSAGNLERLWNGSGEITDFEHDLAGQLVAIHFADGTVDRLDYDEHGDLRWVDDGRARVGFERDPLRRLVGETQAFGGETFTVETRLDALGARVERRTSLGHTERIERDGMGHRRRVLLDGRHKVVQTPNLLGQEVARALQDGGLLESAFDPLGRLVQRRALAPTLARPVAPGEPAWVGLPPGVVRAAKVFGYAVGGDLVEVWDQERGSTVYRHDPMGRIVAAVPERARAELFRYDSEGNVVDAGEGGAPRELGPGNRLLRQEDARYGYDRSGRRIEKRLQHGDGREEVWKYTWDAKGQLRAVHLPDGGRVEMAYDPLGRRVEKRLLRPRRPGGPLAPAEVTRFFWDGDVLVHSVKRAGEGHAAPLLEAKTFCFEDDSFVPFAHRDGDRDDAPWFHYLNDVSGAPDRLIAADGTVAASVARSVWGRTEPMPEEATTSTPLGFQGQYHDDETGLAYNRARYYDPGSGGYISPDALGLLGGGNAYAYVDNPLRMADPLGLVPSAAELARQRADSLLGFPNSRRPPCVTAVVDKTTGDVSYGSPPPPKGRGSEPPLDMQTAHPFIRERAAALPPDGIASHGQPPGNCGEPKALDQALKSGAKPENLEMHTVYVGGKLHGQAKPRCQNCGTSTADIYTTSD